MLKRKVPPLGLIGHRLYPHIYSTFAVSANVVQNVVENTFFEDLKKPSQNTCFSRCRASSGPPFLPPRTPCGPPELPSWHPWALEATQFANIRSYSFMFAHVRSYSLIFTNIRSYSLIFTHIRSLMSHHPARALKRPPRGLAPAKTLPRTSTPLVLPKTSRSRKGAAVARQRFQLLCSIE